MFPGGVIGRLPSAGLLVDDPKVSEAHAMIAVRRGRLEMLALRRLLEVGGKPLKEVELRVGLEIGLSEDTRLSVLEVHLPERVLSVVVNGGLARELGAVASLYGGGDTALRARFDPEADAHVWSLGGAWRVRRAHEVRAQTMTPPYDLELDGRSFAFRLVAAGRAGASTKGAGGRLAPIRLVCHFDGVEIHRPDRPVTTVGGIGGRILSELATFGAPMPWAFVAAQVWEVSEEQALAKMRHRWDGALNRLRARLQNEGLRADLVVADRSGCVQFVLHTGDSVEDRT